MGPLRSPSYLSLERCLASGQGLATSHRTTAAHAQGRGRRRSYRYVGVSPTPVTECGGVITTSSASSPSCSTAPQKGGGALAEQACGFSCTLQLARSSTGVLTRALISLPLTEAQKKQLDDAARKLLGALQLSCTGSPIGLLAGHIQAHAGRARASSILGQSSHADVASAAVLLPLLTWQWLSVVDLESWVDRGVAHLLRETLLVQKAATDTSASVNELVGWCLDNCSRPAATLAALWGQQQAQTLPPRCRSFYGLILQRLGLSGGLQVQPQPQMSLPSQTGVNARAAIVEGGLSAGVGACSGSSVNVQYCFDPRNGDALATVRPAVVMCSSVARTALSASPRRRSSKGCEEGVRPNEDEGADGSSRNSCSGGCSGSDCAAGGNYDSGGLGESGAVGSDLGLDPNPDLVVLGELPAAARVLLQQSGLEDSKDEIQPPQQQLQKLQTKPPEDGMNGSHSSDGSSAAPCANGIGVAGRGLQGMGETALDGISVVRADDRAPSFADPSAAAGATMEEAAGVEASMSDEAMTFIDLQTPLELPSGLSSSSAGSSNVLNSTAGLSALGAITRPTASLLQRPSRSPAAEAELDPGAEGSADASDTAATDSDIFGSGLDSPSWDFRRGVLGSQQSYMAVRLVATGSFPLRDISGTVLADGLVVPETGPIVISTDPRIFPGSEAVVSDYSTPAGDKLAMRLEYIVDRSFNDEVTLQLFNISRIKRKRTDNCRIFVNGKPVNVGDPGCVLTPGDVVWFGHRSFCFRVEVLRGLPSAVNDALQGFCTDDTTALAGYAAADGAVRADADTIFRSDGGETSSDELQYVMPSTSSTSELLSEPDMVELSNMSRRDPLRAEAALRRLAAAKPADAGVWLIWAQTAARMEGPIWQAKARLLFRAAVEAARVMEVIPPPPAALQVAAQRSLARRRGVLRRSAPTGVVSAGATSAGSTGTASSYDDAAAEAYGYAVSGQVAAPSSSGSVSLQRHNWLLVQALGNWAKHEWRLRMYGSARHLFRAAVDEAARHPDGVGGGGGAAILHYWASRELDALNVRNARIVVAEALRKCPADVALYVLAAGVELEGGNLEMAKTYCQRAYALDRTDKQLFLVWPRVEAALGDRLKARLLYERALDMYPLNTKILNLYARFEAEEGSYREAAELYDRALRIDSLSPVMGVHNRADWASLEADLGNTGLARTLLEGGLAAHPRSTPLLVTLAKVERLEGRYEDALRLVRAAQAIAGAFNVAVMTERSQVLRAMGEREMAANLVRHVASVKELNRMKQQGYWGSEAWRAFIEATRSPEQQSVVAAARGRKQQLGWAPTVRGAKPQPTGQAGEGRRAAAPEAQQWLQLEHLRLRRAEARRVAIQRAARMQASEEGDGGGDVASDMTAAMGPTAAALGSRGDDEYDDYYDEPPVGVPSLDSVRRPMPEDEDVYDT